MCVECVLSGSEFGQSSDGGFEICSIGSEIAAGGKSISSLISIRREHLHLGNIVDISHTRRPGNISSIDLVSAVASE